MVVGGRGQAEGTGLSEEMPSHLDEAAAQASTEEG